MDQVSLTEAAKLAVVDDILGYISQIEGDLPFMLDLRTIAAWSVYADTIVEYIVTLVETGRFQRVTWPMLATIKRHAYAADVLKVFEGEIGYVHADLSCENVLVAAEGYRVIDWQRPIWGPTALDRATLLSSMGLDPVPIVGLGVAQLGRLLLIAWLVEAALHWFPDGAAHYDTQIAH
ncbi:MAG: phosphotransferase, partial [Anaerolineae bacterium]|nr:phosphotransferase [Anaerolineae bacterium]